MDPGATLLNWQQAFEGYRIAQTRTIEKQLRSQATQNKEKLRTLVGYVQPQGPSLIFSLQEHSWSFASAANED